MTDGLYALKDWKSDYVPNAVQFRQMCLPKTISPDGTNSGAYKLFEPEKLIEDKSSIEKTEKAGKTALNEMKELFP